ncbi:hypothetical protein KAJ87_03845, partial [Candidatus Pacearchaeota archaeon]|nr:hypothetical protein [Candidatus Pacearchaeota archaeon]
ELELSVSEAGAVCGDNNLEGTEVCECGLDSAFGTADDDVGVETCELQGYDSGDLYCASGCVGYDAGSCVSDADIIALSCSQEHVQDAINEAVDGDIVQVPVGSCTWSGKVTVDKGITVRGAGIGKTNITNYGFDITDGTDNLRISGFEFNNSILIRGDPCIYVGGYHSSDGVRNFRIDNSRFNDYPTPMLIQGYSTGVIDHNSFYGSSVIFADGIGVWGDNDAAWTRDVGLGTDDFVFLENNIFDNNGDEIGHVVTSSHGGRFVFRYNTIRENGHRILDPVDVHGNGHGSNNRGGMVFEIYENTFIRDSLGMSRAIRLRGGTGVVFNNIFDETVDVYDEHIELTDYRAGKYQPMSPNTCASAEFCPIVDGGEGHPCCDQIGRGRDQVNEPLYTWGNENHNEIAVTPTVPSVVSEYIQVNRDYYVGIEKPGYTPYTYPHPLTQS